MKRFNCDPLSSDRKALYLVRLCITEVNALNILARCRLLVRGFGKYWVRIHTRTYFYSVVEKSVETITVHSRLFNMYRKSIAGALEERQIGRNLRVWGLSEKLPIQKYQSLRIVPLGCCVVLQVHHRCTLFTKIFTKHFKLWLPATVLQQDKTTNILRSHITSNAIFSQVLPDA